MKCKGLQHYMFSNAFRFRQFVGLLLQYCQAKGTFNMKANNSTRTNIQAPKHTHRHKYTHTRANVGSIGKTYFPNELRTNSLSKMIQKVSTEVKNFLWKQRSGKEQVKLVCT